MEQTNMTGMPEAPVASSSKKLWIIGIIIVLVVAGGYLALRSSDTTGDEPAVTQLVNELVINDQNPDSVAVLVAQASLNTPGYVVIHDNNNGQPGKVIGVSKLLTPNEYNNVSVIAPLKPGATYFGMIHVDDGNGLYDTKTDITHLHDAADNEIIKMFKVLLADPNGENKG